MTGAFINILVLVFFPFLFLGVINRVKSSFAGRKGPSVFQPFYDFLKLLRKGEVISHTTTWVFWAAPAVILSSTLCAAVLTPLAGHRALLSFTGDFVVFAYLLGLSRFFAVISAMDTGSSFEGMGASREAAFSVLVEPAFFIIIASLAAMSGAFSFESVFFLLKKDGVLALLIIAMSVLTLFIMLLAEGKRVPVDDPNTHLELTMIHEVMVLDNSGPDLAFILYGSAVKIVLICSLIANLVLPPGLGAGVAFALYAGILVFLAVCVGVVESMMARLRMTHVPQFLFSMTAVGLIILSTLVIFAFGGLK
jgi:formate hydrogenlyase subunit 4